MRKTGLFGTHVLVVFLPQRRHVLATRIGGLLPDAGGVASAVGSMAITFVHRYLDEWLMVTTLTVDHCKNYSPITSCSGRRRR